ncbi:hypothetical protein QI633_11315 [Nocardioides sp. QY071]|uniref:hypothetical protein n=1 Tax=Nocardioides sp. QY071 TaxID=3044187 RepID=UPI00249A6E07|nr:hypothetical protein [Nocardioides sp. QY071]WGY04335.1 hypothetical protein QI633_11315 [Nocardioides sp. QY071]
MRTWEDVSTGRKQTCVDIDGDLSRGSEDFSELAPDDARRLAIAMLTAAEIADRSPAELRAPDQTDVDAVRQLLDLLECYSSNDQRARYLLSSNWMRDRGAFAGARLRAVPSGSESSGAR